MGRGDADRPYRRCDLRIHRRDSRGRDRPRLFQPDAAEGPARPSPARALRRRSPLSSGRSWANRRRSSRSSMSTAASCSRCSSAATRRVRCAAISSNAFMRWRTGSRRPARPEHRIQIREATMQRSLRDARSRFASEGCSLIGVLRGAAAWHGFRGHRQRAAAAQSVAMGHVHGCRHRREGGDDRPCLCLAGHLDGLARKDHRARAARRAARRRRAGVLESATLARRGRAQSRDGQRRRARSSSSAAAARSRALTDGFATKA